MQQARWHTGNATMPRASTKIDDGLGFGTSFTNESEKPVIGNNQRVFFFKQSAQSVILKTNFNQ